MMLTKRQEEIIIGSLLGDGYLEKRGNSVRFGFCQSEKRKFYVEWKYNELRNLVEEPIKHYEYQETRTGRKYGFSIFKTVSHPQFKDLYEKFYKNDKKVVPDDIKRMLTPLVLAVWYMDDGSLSKGAPILNTHTYSVEDQFKLCAALKKFYIVANLNRDRGRHRIRILKRCAKRFADLIRPYILPEFLYKLPG